MLVFILMFLLGTMVFMANQENEELLAKLETLRNVDERLAELESAKKLFVEEIITQNISNPDEVISNLVIESKAREEISHLKELIEDQDERLSALSEVQQAIDKVAQREQNDFLIQKHIEQTLILAKHLKEKLRQQLKITDGKVSLDDIEQLTKQTEKSLDILYKIEKILDDNPALAKLPGENTLEKIDQLAQEYLAFNAIKADDLNPLVVKKENTDLKGQIQFLKKRLEANGGMDFPPCWADENGKVQMLLTVELRENDLSISRAWPDSRDQDAWSLPNMKVVMASPVSDYGRFLRAVKPISDLSRKQNCRHYVRIRSMINDAVASDRRRLSIEDYFYKIEVRR